MAQPPVFGMDANAPWASVESALGVTSIAGWRGYNTSIPASYPGSSAPIQPGVTVPFVSYKPPLPISAANQTALANLFAATPGGSLSTIWAEGEASGYTPAQIIAAHQLAYSIFKANAPASALYGQVLMTFTSHTSSSHYPVNQWVATQPGGAPLDFYGADWYPSTTNDVSAQDAITAFMNNVNGLTAVVASPVIAVPECNCTTNIWGPGITWKGTTVAASSNGGVISSIGSWSTPSPGVLSVASTTNYPTSGTIQIGCSDLASVAIVTYTGKSSNTFTGCAYVSGAAGKTVITGTRILTSDVNQAQWFTDAWAWATANNVISFFPYYDFGHGVPWPPSTQAIAELKTIIGASSPSLASGGGGGGGGGGLTGTQSVSIAGTAVYGRVTNATGGSLRPAATSIQCPVTNIDGDWMFAIIAWTPPDTPMPQAVSFSVADDVHNWWEPLSPALSTSPAGPLRVSIWVAPAAKQVNSVVMAAPSGRFESASMIVLNVHGLQPWLTPTSVVTDGGFKNILTGTLNAPVSNAFFITAVGFDNALSLPVTLTGNEPWAQFTTVTGPDGVNVTTGFAFASTAPTATWTGAHLENAGFVLGGVLVNGNAPFQANVNWPATVAELGLGSGVLTPPDQVVWTPVTRRFLSMGVTQGRQYQLAALQAGQGTLVLDNQDGAFLPPGSHGFQGIDSGTPFRIRTTWQGGSWHLSFRGDGVTASPQTDTGNIYTVTPNVTYTVSAWLACSVPYPSGVTIKFSWKDSGGIHISDTVSSAVTTTSATVATASGQAPSNATQASVIIRAVGTPASSVTFYAAAVPTGPPGTVVIPPGVTWSGQNNAVIASTAPWVPDRKGPPNNTPWALPFAGFVQQWPQKWSSTTLRGFIEAVITDGYGYLTSNLLPILQQEIGNSDPDWYWPCTDPIGANQAANTALGNVTPLRVIVSKIGGGGAVQGFAENSNAILGAQGTIPLLSSVRASSNGGMWGQTLGSNFPVSSGFCLQCIDGTFPPPSGGVTIEFWFQITGTDPGYSPNLCAFGSNNIFGDYFLIQLSNGGSGRINGALYMGGTRTSTTRVDASVNYWTIGVPTHVTVVFDQNGYTVYINAKSKFSENWTSNVNTFTKLTFGAATLNGYVVATTPGAFGQCAIWARKLTIAEINDHSQAGTAGMAGDTIPNRIERLLAGTPYLGRRAIVKEQGQSVTQVASCQDIAGQPAAISVNNISASALPGAIWTAPCGDIYYQARDSAWNQPADWVLGDRPDLGEIQYTGQLEFGFDPLRILNDIQITQLDNEDVIVPSGAQMLAIIKASTTKYGSLSYDVTGYLQGDLNQPIDFGPGLFDLANWIAAANAIPILRVSTLTVDGSSTPSAWYFVMNAAPGDHVFVNFRPVTAAGEVITVHGRLSQTVRAISSTALSGQVTGSVVITIDFMPESSTLSVDDPVLGQLNGTHILGW